MRNFERVTCFLALALAGACTDGADDLGAPAADEAENLPAADEPGADDPDSVLVRLPGGVERIHYEVVDGHAIWEGDIDLGPVDDLRDRLFGGAVIDDFSQRWPGGVIRYRFDGSVTADTRRKIDQSLADLAAVTPLRFLNIGSDDSGNYVLYLQQGGSGAAYSSDVGMVGGEQTIRFESWDVPSRYLVVHETLHAAGFFHEQGRPDREQWVDINLDCTSDAYQYGMKSEAMALGPYDFDSIMHYKTGTFCATPRPAGCTLLFDVDKDGVKESYCDTLHRDSDGSPVLPGGWLSRNDLGAIWRAYGSPKGVDEANDHFGKAIAVGDFDGDGYEDIAVGAPGEDDGAGKVYVFRGTSNRPVPWQKLHQSAVGFADEAGDEFGAALVAADVDGDGKDELLVGTPGEDVKVGVPLYIDTGAAILFRGTAGGLVGWRGFTQSATGVSSEETGDRFGTSVAIGHLAGKGSIWERAILVGTPFERTSDVRAGAVFAFASQLDPDAFIVASVTNKLAPADGAVNDRFGAALAVGNLDGNGRDDLVVGAPGHASRGAVYVYAGRTPSVAEGSTSPLTTYRSAIAAPSSAAGFGSALAAGQLQGSLLGFHEIVVGAPASASSTGLVLVYEPTSSSLAAGTIQLRHSLSQNAIPEAGDRFGAAVAVGDVDFTNAQDDLIVGAPGEDSGAGAVSVFRGALDGVTALAVLRNSASWPGANEAGDGFGVALATGNIDGTGDGGSSDSWKDGLQHMPDLIVGHDGEAPDNFALLEGPAAAGQFSVFLGRNGAPAGSLAISQSTSYVD